MKNRQEPFKGMYWRQLLVTAGMVLLTLVLLGFVFFSLSYLHMRREQTAELEKHAEAMAKQCVGYTIRNSVDGHHLLFRQLKAHPDFLRLADFTADISGVQFIIYDNHQELVHATGDGIATYTNDDWAFLEELAARIDAARPVREYRNNADVGRLLAGVAAVDPQKNEVTGVVFAASTTSRLDSLWNTFMSLYFVTAAAMMLISFLAVSVTASQMVLPLKEMVRATREYASGDFEIRMKDCDQTDEIGELSASFNQMADILQRQELQRHEFLSNLSHDLKTPLTTIAGYTDGILDGTIPAANERKYLEIISEESRRLSRMVRRMLDVNQFQTMDPLRSGQSFDLCESMRRVLISMEKRITDRKLDVEADIPDTSIFVLGDKDMMIQVLYNLLENAVKFARPESVLYFGVQSRENRAVVRVRNSGDTIPPEELPLLFERFHKTDKSRGADRDGVGLGLYIVKTILKRHREEIYVTSSNGVTEFSFSLRIV
ncbi:MAG: HAMP domain-containing histidine kinase [Oscillibacter sp.]|nr:HAMP domain-containing histidine kinase [Oscillibacter sp.]